MIAEKIYHFLIQSYLNPVLFLGYVFTARALLDPLGISAFTRTGTNSERLVGTVYFVLAPLIYLAWLMIGCCFLQGFDSGLSLSSFMDAEIHWLQYGGYLITGLTIGIYLSRNGMEANIMGFIFVPLLLSGSLIHAFFHFRWVWLVVIGSGQA